MASEIGPEAGDPSRSAEPGSGEGTAFAPPTQPPPTQPPPTQPSSIQSQPPQAWPGYGQQQPQPPYGQQPQPPYGQQPPQPPYGQQPPPYGQPPGIPYGPYGYPPYGYGYPKPPTGTNGLAVAAMVLGICGFLFVTPILGLILGLVALSAVKKSGQRGRGMAISGVTLSSAWIVLFATLITVGILTKPASVQRDADGNVVSPGQVSVFDLHPKDCFTLPPGLIGSTDGKTRTFKVVPCSTPHDSEAIGSFAAAETSYPGTAGLRSDGMSQCLKVLAGYEPDPASLPSSSLVQYIFPNQQAWDYGEHHVTCFIQFPSATLTKSVYRDRSTYTPDQLRFLDAVRPLDDAVSQLNATPQDADLSVLQQRASDIADGAQSEVAALTSAPWPSAVQPSVDSLVAKHREAARLWSQAAGESDIASFGDDARLANTDFDLPDFQAVRTGLGLTAVNPGSGGSGGTGGSTGSTGGGTQSA
ncbi:DUF4190 domain-containing protein [Catenulispora pinisilvae]|uniref:DUF4190 domain-containing protein n=1 Tax=Catenulispora pinisilvae TaxID=2705253 RepID=UPI0018923E2F|nr:DUF4190 domain-containing protein [Catenulispora pinisilvae]